MPLLEYFKEYQGCQVSNCGRVISKKGKEYKGGYSGKGYRQVTLRLDNGKTRTYLVHRLVAMLFVPNDMPQIKTQVNHVFSCKAWNVAPYLEWCTDSENKLAKFEYRRLHGQPLYTEKELLAKQKLDKKLSKPVVYDGQVYASVSAMARHFNYDVRSLSKAIYRGGKWRGHPIRFAA